MSDIDKLNASISGLIVRKPGTDFDKSFFGGDISEKEYQERIKQAEKFGLISPSRDGIFTEYGQSFMKGLHQVLEGTGSTMEEMGVDVGLADWSRRIQRRNQQWNPDPNYSAFSLDPSNIARAIGTGTAQTLSTIGASIAATAVTGGNPVAGFAAGAGMTFAQTYGDTVKEYREAMPEQDEFTVKGLAFLSAAGESLIEMGLGPESKAVSSTAKLIAKEATRDVLKKFGKKAVMEFVKNGVEEGTEEITQSYIRALVKSAGTHNLELPPVEQLAEEFMGGFWPGAVGGSVQSAISSHLQNSKAKKAQSIADPLRTGEMAAAPTVPKGLAKDGASTVENVSGNANQASTETAPNEAAFLSLSKLSPDTRFVPETKESLLANHSNTAQSEYGFFKETTDENGNTVREIHVNLQDPRGIEYVMGHEGFHDITSRSPELAKQIHDVIASGITKKNGKLTSEAQAMLDEVRRSYADLNLDENELNEEFDGNVLGACMRNSDFALSLAAELETRQKNSGVSFVKFVKDWLDKAIDWLAGREAAGEQFDDQTRALFRDYEKTRDKLVKLLADFTEGEYNKQDNARSALIGLIKNHTQAGAKLTAYERENEARAQEQAEGHRRAKEIAIGREQRQAAEVKADEQDAARFMKEANAKQEQEQRQQRREASKALTDEIRKLQDAEAQERKDITANNRIAKEQSEEAEAEREAAKEATKNSISDIVSRLDHFLQNTGVKANENFMQQANLYLKVMEDGVKQQDAGSVRAVADLIAKAAQKFNARENSRPIASNLDKANRKIRQLVSRLDNFLVSTGAKTNAKFMKQADLYLKVMEDGIEKNDVGSVRAVTDLIAKAAQKFQDTMTQRAKNSKTKADATMRVDEHVKWSKTNNSDIQKLKTICDKLNLPIDAPVRKLLNLSGTYSANGLTMQITEKGGKHALAHLVESGKAQSGGLTLQEANEILPQLFDKKNRHFDKRDGHAIYEIIKNDVRFKLVNYEDNEKENLASLYSNRDVKQTKRLLSAVHPQAEAFAQLIGQQPIENIVQADENTNSKQEIDSFQPVDKTSDSSNKNRHTTIKNSLVRQVNPIVTNGQIHEEYQSLLDTLQTTPFNLEKLEAKARAWFERVGDNAFDMIRNQEEPGRDLGTVIRRMAMETEEFRQLPEEERSEIMTRHIMEGSDWSHEGMARQMANRVIRTAEDAKRLFGRMKEKLDDKTYQKIRQNVLKETGIDIEALPKDIVEDRSRLDQVMREAITSRASIGDKIYEYWINAILSAPGTHVTNTVGNVANLTYELTLKRIAEAGINRLAGRKDGATFGELKTMWRTLANKEVLRNAISVSRESFEQEVTKGGKFQESSGIAISGKLGRAIRIPTRMLRAADEFAKAIIVPIETAAMAYREGTAKGLTGEALNDYIDKQMKDPNSKARQFGDMRSLELTFQEKPGVAVDTLVALKTAGGFYGTVAKYLLPFVKTPANLLGQGVRKSPLGILNLAKEGIDIARGKRGFDNEVIAHAAEQLIAWGGIMALMGMASDDDDDMPFITGSSTAPGSGERDFRSRNIPAYSIRIGDKWYSYQRIEPLSTALAIIADGINTYRRAETTGDASGALKEAFGGALRLIGEKSYLQSIGEIVDLMQNPERSGSRWATDFVASWVPNAFRSASNSFDEYKQDTKVRSSGEQWWIDNFHVVMSKAGFERLAPKVDCFGREVTREGAEDSGLVGWALRANLFATHRKDYGDMNEAEQLLWNWNTANPKEQYWPQVPNYKFKRGNANYVLTGEDYHDFAVDSGQLAYRQIQNAINHRVINVARPRENDIKIIRKIFEKARKVTREKYISNGRAEREE